MLNKLALIAGIVLPFFNIPLIVKIIQRKSSKDISLLWALGVWICLIFMFPSAIQSPDYVWRTFSIINFFFFTCVLAVTLKFRKG